MHLKPFWVFPNYRSLFCRRKIWFSYLGAEPLNHKDMKTLCSAKSNAYQKSTISFYQLNSENVLKQIRSVFHENMLICINKVAILLYVTDWIFQIYLSTDAKLTGIKLLQLHSRRILLNCSKPGHFKWYIWSLPTSYINVRMVLYIFSSSISY